MFINIGKEMMKMSLQEIFGFTKERLIRTVIIFLSILVTGFIFAIIALFNCFSLIGGRGGSICDVLQVVKYIYGFFIWPTLLVEEIFFSGVIGFLIMPIAMLLSLFVTAIWLYFISCMYEVIREKIKLKKQLTK
jgi:hypothetical protein